MTIQELMDKAKDTFRAGRAFGPPIEADGCVIVPVAITGGGGGGGEGISKESETGVGGGFGGVTWPLGVYVIRDGNVKWVPAVDATRIVLGALAVARVAVRVRALRRSR